MNKIQYLSEHFDNITHFIQTIYKKLKNEVLIFLFLFSIFHTYANSAVNECFSPNTDMGLFVTVKDEMLLTIAFSEVRAIRTLTSFMYV